MVPLTTEDQRKLHAEINQLVNQRFLINTAAVTLFGVIIAWMIPKNITTEQVSAFHFGASILLLVLLFALYFISHLLRITTRVLTTYLIEKKASVWENDWRAYRSKKGYMAYTKSQAVIFLVLGFLSTLAPFALAFLFPQPRPPVAFEVLAALSGVAVFYTILVVGMGFKDWFYDEEAIRVRWNDVLPQEEGESAAT